MTNAEKEAVMQSAYWLIEEVLKLGKFIATHDRDIKHQLHVFLLSIKEDVATLERSIDDAENNNKL